MDLPEDAQHVHLLRALFFMKQHPQWALVGKVTGASKPTFQECTWLMIHKLFALHPNLVRFVRALCCG